MRARALAVAVALIAACTLHSAASSSVAGASLPTTLDVSAVDTVGMTVSDMERAIDFYTSVLTFDKVSDDEISGRDYELMTGVFGARARIVRLRLGDEAIELTEYLTPKGRAFPADMRPNDRAFQHIAIIVSDMDKAYERLRQRHVEHASTGPQRLPDWNPNAGGISAFYFRDPDEHFLEILHFPAGKGLEKWHRQDRLFLGVDHTAIVVNDTDETLKLYRDALGMRVAGESENYDTEQEHLNNVFGARLRITALRAAEGPGIELLEYLAPRDGRPAAADTHANDVVHWQTTLITRAPERVNDLLRLRLFSLVSPSVVSLPTRSLNVQRAILVRDADGHGLRLAAR
jgi:catechol 2,3-dioxygenase-like lactoylglutathione lyase family enzyme